jgi:hypothetical protein
MRFSTVARGTASSLSTVAVKFRNSFDERDFDMRNSSVALLVLLASCAMAQSQPPLQPEPARNASGAYEQTGRDPRGTNVSPLIVRIEPTPKTDAESAEEQREKEEQAADRRFNQRLAVATLGILLLQLVVVGFQVRLLVKQNEIIDGQSAIMRGQREAADAQSGYMREGLQYTKTTADAAMKSAEAAVAAMKFSQDALVLFEGMERVNALLPTTRLTAVFKNHGSVAARRTEVTIAVLVAGKKVHSKSSTPITVGPQAPLKIATDQLDSFIGQDVIDRVIGGNDKLLLILKTQYRGASDPAVALFAATYNTDTKTFTRTEIEVSAVEQVVKAKTADQPTAKE